MTSENPPVDIQGVTERAHRAIMDDPDHNLALFYRSLIYSLLGPPHGANTRLRRGKLAITTVDKVLPIWENEWPNDRRPHNLLAQASDVLAGLISMEEGRLAANNAFDQTAEWFQTIDEANASKKSLAASYVLAASVESLFEASGVNTFGAQSPTSTEADLDPWTADAAAWAVSAYAGPWYDSSSNSEKRREFWLWWITEAAPAVLAT